MTNKPEWWYRFWDKVDITGECWNWTGAKNQWGYGRFGIDGKNKHAARVIYELKFGPIPPKMEVCHHCDNPSCVNPEHLFLGTHDDNMVDLAKKGRGLKSLTKEQVTEILKAEGTQKAIADRFGVSQPMVCHIKKGNRHKTVEELL